MNNRRRRKTLSHADVEDFLCDLKAEADNSSVDKENFSAIILKSSTDIIEGEIAGGEKTAKNDSDERSAKQSILSEIDANVENSAEYLLSRVSSTAKTFFSTDIHVGVKSLSPASPVAVVNNNENSAPGSNSPSLHALLDDVLSSPISSSLSDSPLKEEEISVEQLIREFCKITYKHDINQRKSSAAIVADAISNQRRCEIGKLIVEKTKYKLLPSRTTHPAQFLHPSYTLEGKKSLLLSLSPMLSENETQRIADLTSCEIYTRCKVEKCRGRNSSFDYVDIDIHASITTVEYEKRYLLFIESSKVFKEPKYPYFIIPKLSLSSSSSLSLSSGDCFNELELMQESNNYGSIDENNIDIIIDESSINNDNEKTKSRDTSKPHRQKRRQTISTADDFLLSLTEVEDDSITSSTSTSTPQSPISKGNSRTRRVTLSPASAREMMLKAMEEDANSTASVPPEFVSSSNHIDKHEGINSESTYDIITSLSSSSSELKNEPPSVALEMREISESKQQSNNENNASKDETDLLVAQLGNELDAIMANVDGDEFVEFSTFNSSKSGSSSSGGDGSSSSSSSSSSNDDILINENKSANDLISTSTDCPGLNENENADEVKVENIDVAVTVTQQDEVVNEITSQVEEVVVCTSSILPDNDFEKENIDNNNEIEEKEQEQEQQLLNNNENIDEMIGGKEAYESTSSLFTSSDENLDSDDNEVETVSVLPPPTSYVVEDEVSLNITESVVVDEITAVEMTVEVQIEEDNEIAMEERAFARLNVRFEQARWKYQWEISSYHAAKAARMKYLSLL